ncbi:DUF3558 domain-containing protein [Nocardia jiangsuensis]|uniref:DUF3558 domain-containing protein n=1 Tax=Nocardia jiangsuensis TaxID=1691563 RepID=A0ABV8DX75_9NOCA
MLAIACVSTGCGEPEGETATKTSEVVTPAPSTSVNPDAELWDPCHLPDSAISATGLDPKTEVPDVAGVDFDGWQVCTWQSNAEWYSLGVLSGTPTLQAVRARDDFVGITDYSIGTRAGVQFLDAGDDKGLNCSIAVEIPQGTVMFYLTTRYSIGKQGDPCTEVRQHADALGPYLP